MSIKYYDKSGATPEEKLLAGVSPVDAILNGTSKNAIQNKAVYNALKDKLEAATTDLIYYYLKTDVYNKSEVRALIGAVETLTMEVVSSLPVSDISTTTIYLLKPTGSNVYDEYVYINDAWVKIGTTDMDLSGYMLTADFNVAIADYFTKAEINNLLNSYYTKAEIDADFYDKDAVDDLLDAKQDTLTFDSTPTASSSNPVTSNGIKTAIDARIFSNPNLLDNPFFSVNSRGKSVYAGEGIVSTYCVDRWSLYNWWSSSSTTACVLNSDGTITLNNNTESSNRQFVQFVPFEYLRVGESYTASIDVVSITGSASFNMQQDTSPWTGVSFVSSITSPGIKTGTKNWVEVTDTKVRLFISLAANTSITIRAMKLEKGSISTLNLDTAPNYATEFAKCRASKADSTDTYSNQGEINVGTSNPNLLDNPWFTVNQRGQSSYDASQSLRTVDRWVLYYGQLVINSDGSVTISVESGNQLQFQNRVDPLLSKMLHGKVVTLSAIVNDALHSFSFVWNHTDNVIQRHNINNTWSLDFRNIPADGDRGHFVRLINADTTSDTNITIKAVKLELGSVSTLANDTVPNYQQELAKCQRYFQRIGQAGSSDTLCMATYRNDYTLRTVLPLTVPMRAAPSVTVNGTVSDYTNSGLTMAKISQPVTNGGAVGISFNISKSGITWNNGVSKCITPDSTDFYIDLSADL